MASPFLSKGGRITLIKSSLARMPNYFLSFTITVLVAKKLEKSYKDFLWNDEEKEKKYHLMN